MLPELLNELASLHERFQISIERIYTPRHADDKRNYYGEKNTRDPGWKCMIALPMLTPEIVAGEDFAAGSQVIATGEGESLLEAVFEVLADYKRELPFHQEDIDAFDAVRLGASNAVSIEPR